jgi:hypothetical protein
MHHSWRLKVSSIWEFLLAHSVVVLSAMMKNAAIDVVEQSQNHTVKTFKMLLLGKGEYKSTNEAYFKIFFCKFSYKILVLNFFRILTNRQFSLVLFSCLG